MKLISSAAVALFSTAAVLAQDVPVTIWFQAVAGSAELACGQSYDGIGTSKSRIEPKDFRFYVHNIRLLDENGQEVPIALKQDGRWQFEDVALLDFEDGTGACSNGTADLNTQLVGRAPADHIYHGLRFTLGVPFAINHTNVTQVPSPLNLTAMSWTWNAGRKFARIEFASTGNPQGYTFHLGSTGCQPSQGITTPPTFCAHANRVEVSFPTFERDSNVVLVDLAALLQDSDVDVASGACTSSADDPDCAPLFGNLGLPFGQNPVAPQTFFRLGKKERPSAARR